MSKIKKRTNGHLVQIELEALRKAVPLLVEMQDLLEQLESKNISEFETTINKRSGFVNSLMSASAYGKEAEYSRLLELEKQINNRLTSEDLTKSKELKSSVIAKVIDSHTEFYTETEQKTKKTLEGLMKSFNSLTIEERQNIGFNRNSQLAWTMYSELRF